MTSPTKAQLAAILGAIALLVLLLFARKTGAPESSKKSESPAKGYFSMEHYIDSVKNTLSNSSQMLLSKQAALQNPSAFDSISRLWKSFNNAGIEAYYLKQFSLKQNIGENWNKTGETFYKASRFAKDPMKRYFIDEALQAFTKSIELDSNQLTAKVNLGICYVESTQEPMKGIMLLREVVAKDSTNIDAQLNLGLFAVQSGQYDKAIERFKKIIRSNPNYAEAYLYLGQTYANTGKKKEAIDALEKFKELSKDETVVSEVTQYINQLKNS